jgi:hypothetical protein
MILFRKHFGMVGMASRGGFYRRLEARRPWIASIFVDFVVG